MKLPNILSPKNIAATVLAMSASSVMPMSAEATKTTTITHDMIAVCVGSDAGGGVTGHKVGSQCIVKDGNATHETPTTELTGYEEQMDEGLDAGKYITRLHRNFTYTYFPGDTSVEEGWRLNDINNDGAEVLILNGKNLEEYQNDLYLLPGDTPDKDILMTIGNSFKVYPSPFDANGTIKAEWKNAKIKPISSSVDYKDIGWSGTAIDTDNKMGFLLHYSKNIGGVGELTKLVITNNGVMIDSKIITADDVEEWKMQESQFITMIDGTGKIKKYLSTYSSSKNGQVLYDVNDLSKSINNSYWRTECVDPQKQYEFGVSTKGLFILDLKTNMEKTVPVNNQNINSLHRHLSFLSGYTNPTWELMVPPSNGVPGKSYMIELTNPTTMDVEVTEEALPLFKDNFNPVFGKGGAACVTIPNAVAKIVVTDDSPEVVEKDAGSSDAGGSNDADAGSTDKDVAVEVQQGETTNSPDAGDVEQKDIPVEGPDAVDAQDAQNNKDSADSDGDGKPDISVQPDEQTKIDADKPDTAQQADNGAQGTDNGNAQPDATQVKQDALGTDTNMPPIVTPPPKYDSCTASPTSSETPIGTASLILLSALMLSTAERRRKILAMIKM